ncbi:MAG: hypothetical protein IT314_00120 [Anaerolineales bacterium]|nr:hypothetical protein [Anaerolineales bacterium]
MAKLYQQGFATNLRLKRKEWLKSEVKFFSASETTEFSEKNLKISVRSVAIPAL